MTADDPAHHPRPARDRLVAAIIANVALALIGAAIVVITVTAILSTEPPRP